MARPGAAEEPPCTLLARSPPTSLARPPARAYIGEQRRPPSTTSERGHEMTGFDDRKRQEESRYKHDQELLFKARNRGNKLFGLWVAERLGLSGEAASNYAKDVVMADFEMPGDDDIFVKVQADLSAKSIEISDRILQRQLQESRETAAQQIKSE